MNDNYERVGTISRCPVCGMLVDSSEGAHEHGPTYEQLQADLDAAQQALERGIGEVEENAIPHLDGNDYHEADARSRLRAWLDEARAALAGQAAQEERPTPKTIKGG